MTDETMRESFECAFRDEYPWGDFVFLFRRHKDYPECYQYPFMQDKWALWQAAYLAGARAEREACAKVCDAECMTWWSASAVTAAKTAELCAAAIRARGEQNEISNTPDGGIELAGLSVCGEGEG